MTGASSDSYLGGLFRTASAGNIARKCLRWRAIARRPRISKPKREPRPRKQPACPKRDEVAELLSQGLEFDQIAERIGITVKAAQRHFEKIRQRLGPQAT